MNELCARCCPCGKDLSADDGCTELRSLKYNGDHGEFTARGLEVAGELACTLETREGVYRLLEIIGPGTLPLTVLICKFSVIGRD